MEKATNLVGCEADNDNAWAARSEFWRTYVPTQNRRGPKKRYRYREPLILCGHGIRIRVDHNTLLIRTGLTHYPQKADQFRFFPGDANLPDRIIVLDGSGGLSFDALNWMAEQRIEFVRLDWRGQLTSIGGNSGYSAKPDLVHAQLDIRDKKRQIEIARWLISEKLEASIKTLRNSIPKLEIRENAISRIKGHLSKVQNSRISISISQLLGIEGHCAAAYFGVWRGIPLRWTGSRRIPIPDNWAEISPRAMAWRTRARSARHPINAMLNYGYGILANRVRAEVIAAGLDPALGILHGSSQNPIPLVYDLMEPLRPVVDCNILGFALSHMFTPEDFTINKWGACRLNPQMAKIVATQITAIGNNQFVNEFLKRLR